MKRRKLWHILFEAGLVFKLLNGLLELVSGAALLFIKQDTLAGLTALFFREELLEDPQDKIANYLMRLVTHLSGSTELFASIFLLVHGVIKLSLVWGLYWKKLWVYTLAQILLAVFVAYQLYRFSHTGSILLLLLSVIDVFVIFLIRTEYKRLISLGAV
ncbi:MAG: DUF2127 domain-containing protein [Planctomycetaceae bacterium]|nr:DUF2127 domain-containing protein [Planctomycetaceae bacterium]